MIQPELLTVYNINYSTVYRSGHFFNDPIHKPEIYSHKHFLNNPFFL